LKMMGEDPNPIEWNFQNHQQFDKEFQKNIFNFILCLKRKIPKQFQPPKPIFSIIVNFSLHEINFSKPLLKRKRDS